MASAPTSKTRTRKTNSAPAPAPAEVTTTEAGIGTADNLSKEGNALVTAIRKIAKPREVTTVDYGGGNEVMVKVSGITACYLIQKMGSTDVTARYRQKGLNIKGVGSAVTVADAAKQIVAHLDARPPRKSRGASTETTKPATTAKKSGTVKKSTSTKKANSTTEQTLANGLRESARQTGATKRARSRSRTPRS